MKLLPLPFGASSWPALSRAILVALLAFSSARAGESAPPAVGDTAPNFTLRTLDDRTVELYKLTAERPVVLVVLRGWPGYQCPNCTRQAHDYVARAAEFAAHGAQMLMVYPGPAEALQAHAQLFLTDKQWPAEFHFVIDPDYAFTNAYGLRWDAKKETAYPSTFVLDGKNRVRFALVSHTHGGRAEIDQVLAVLK